MKKLHIGCGYNKLKGYINIDKAPEVEPDQVVDIEKGLPFEDDYFDEIYSYHSLEHIRPFKWDFVLEEIYRVSKNGCILKFHLPFDNMRNRGDEDHYKTFCWHSFNHSYVKTGRNYYKKFLVKPLMNKPIFLVRWFFYFFPMLKNDIYFEFEVVK